MFVRMKKSGNNQYLQIVENRKVAGKVVQRVISTIGRLDRLNEKGDIETLVRSLARYSEKVLLVLSGKSEVSAETRKIGPALIFERLWKELGIPKVLDQVLRGRLFWFDVERAVFLTVLHRLMVSGSDRFCDKWRRDYRIEGVEDLSLHHLYRAMSFLGEEIEDQAKATPFSPRCTKDRLEEAMFLHNRHLFSGLNMVFFDTTSIYFEGEGGDALGEKGFSKDKRPDLNQMIVGVVLDDKGTPLCCEMWPGNTTDVKTLLPVIERIRGRFHVVKFCIVADRGMISRDTLEILESPENTIPYILGERMRLVKEVREEVLSRAGRYREVRPEGKTDKDPSPLKVKEVWLGDKRHIVCLNPKQARKDAQDREAIIKSLEEQLKSGAKKLIGNKGYRKYLKVDRGSISIDMKKVEEEARFDGKWVLRTNTNLSAEKVALKYKELWQVEYAFRDMKSTFETRPVFHQRDRTIRGHVFCSFLALVLRKELARRLEAAGNSFEWSDIKQDLKALQETIIEDGGKRLAVRSQCLGTCGKIFQAVGVAIPPTIREI
jgi:transposase